MQRVFIRLKSRYADIFSDINNTQVNHLPRNNHHGNNWPLATLLSSVAAPAYRGMKRQNFVLLICPFITENPKAPE